MSPLKKLQQLFKRPAARIHIGVAETVKLYDHGGTPHLVEAKIDTGADRTSIDLTLAASLGLMDPANILKEIQVNNALGKQQKRPVIGVTFNLAGKTIISTASVTDRGHLKKPMLVGRKDLKGFAVVFDE